MFKIREIAVKEQVQDVTIWLIGDKIKLGVIDYISLHFDGKSKHVKDVSDKLAQEPIGVDKPKPPPIPRMPPTTQPVHHKIQPQANPLQHLNRRSPPIILKSNPPQMTKSTPNDEIKPKWRNLTQMIY